MPILAAEANVYPETLLEELDFEQQSMLDETAWWIFYTRPRQEKSLARDLLQQQIAFYLPLVPRRLLIRSRPVYAYVPLFTGYVFGFGSDADRVRALTTHRVAQVLTCRDGEQLRADLKNIQRLIEAGVPLTVESRLQPGDLVRVRGGPCLGLEGIVNRRKNETRLLVWVKMLQQGVSLEIEDYLLEPIA